jgi:hypothetical protein
MLAKKNDPPQIVPSSTISNQSRVEIVVLAVRLSVVILRALSGNTDRT